MLSRQAVIVCVWVWCLVIAVDGFVLQRSLGRHHLSRHHSGQHQQGFFQSPTALASVLECKDESCNFQEEVVKSSSSGIIVVDFYADWCGPCKIAAKTFAAVAAEWPDRTVKFVKVNTEHHEETVDDYSLKGLPVFGIFKNGRLVRKHEGNIGKEKLLEFISQGIAAAETL